jgi:ABC-type antimicrobial peptide transport system permease subunit
MPYCWVGLQSWRWSWQEWDSSVSCPTSSFNARELALRTALGARQIDLIAQVLRQGLRVAGAGLIVGLLGSIAVVRPLQTMLYGVTLYDPVTYLLVPAVLLSVAAIACFAPALRASRVDPISLLKT